MAAHMRETEFILGFLDEVFHVATLAVQPDNFLGSILPIGHNECACGEKFAGSLRFAKLNFVYNAALLAP